MERRAAIAALIVLVCASPGHAQPLGKVWRIGLLRFGDKRTTEPLVSSLQAGLRELGYLEGKNLVLEQRYAEGKAERVTAFAQELVRLQVDVIVAGDSEAVHAAQNATSAIPIVMSSAIDPVGSGFVKSLAHPGGNTTGISNMTGETYRKLIELMYAVVPKLSRVALLTNPSNPAHASMRRQIEQIARSADLGVLAFEANTAQQIDGAFVAMNAEGAQALLVANDAFFNQRIQQISGLARSNRLPSIAGFPLYARAGLMMAYGPDLAGTWRQCARQIDKIIRGAKPSDLPVEQPTVIQLVINIQTAKTIGLTIPQQLLLRADELIE